MKHKRRALALALLLALSACQPNHGIEEPAQEPETVRILTIGDTAPAALERVSGALSELTMERLGCRVQLQVIGAEAYDERIDDLLLESSFADIFVCRDRSTLNKLLDGNHIYRLDRYLQEYPEFRQTIPQEDAWAPVQVDGYTYGIPFGSAGTNRWGFLMREDVCTQLGIDASSITTLEQLHQVLLQVRDARPDLIPVAPDYGQVETFASSALLRSGGGCLIAADGVSGLCALPEFMQRCEIMRQWYQEGLLLNDTLSGSESRADWIASGLAFGSFAQLGRYTARELEYTLGMPVECALLEDPFYSDDGSDMSFVVYAYTEEVDLCLQVLRLLYTDPEVLRLCIYGQEGVDYTLSSSGAAVPAAETEERYVSWCWPLRSIAPAPMTRQDPEWYSAAEQGNGFFFDDSAVRSEAYQCREVLKKYYEVLCAGVIDPHNGIALMAEELQAANIEAVRTELARQWAAWSDFQ